MPTLHLIAPGNGPADELSRRQAADLLQMTPRGIDKLLASGYLPDLAIDRILRLSRRPILHADGPQPVLRQGVAQPAPDDEQPRRKWIGEGAALSDSEQLEADRMWWRCDHTTVIGAGLLPVTVAGFPTTVLRIHNEPPTQVRRIIPGREGKAPTVEVRWAFAASLAARVRSLGEPHRDWVADDLTDEDRTKVEAVLSGRSTARSGGPIAYLPIINA